MSGRDPDENAVCSLDAPYFPYHRSRSKLLLDSPGHRSYYECCRRLVPDPNLLQGFNYLIAGLRSRAMPLDYANLRIETDLERAYDNPSELLISH